MIKQLAEYVISDCQAKMLALAFYQEIRPYIEEHGDEYQAWLQSQDNKN